MLILVKAIGWLIAITPEPLLRLVCQALGAITYHTQPKRRLMAERNLNHCFPDKDAAWRRTIIKEHCRRLIETSLFVLASPFFSEKRAKGIITMPDSEVTDVFNRTAQDQPCVLLLPHFTLCEAVVTVPLHCPRAKGRVATLFRPLDHPKMNDWVTHSRSRFGVELLSRKDGYSKAIEYLDQGNSVGLLFDQNASGKGSLIFFMDRIISATELPGLLARKKRASAYILYPERTSFWRAQLRIEKLPMGKHPLHLTIAAHDWLANYLASSDDHCADWLWLHDKWGTQKNPKRRFRGYRLKRNRLGQWADYQGKSVFPRATKIWFRLPDDETKFRDLPEVMRTIREARPDYAFCLISVHSTDKIVSQFGELPDRIVTLCRDEDSELALKDIAKTYPDVWIDLEGSRESVSEMQLANAEQRFSFCSPGEGKRAVTHYGPPPSEHSWRPFFERFGLESGS